jgi:hypothetical protein
VFFRCGIDNKAGNLKHGVYRMQFSFKNNENNKIKRSFYYITSEKKKKLIPLTAKGAKELYNRVLPCHLERHPKRPRTNFHGFDVTDEPEAETTSNLICRNIESTCPSDTPQPTNLTYTYWSSGDARKLFCPNENELTIMSVHRLIETCEQRAKAQPKSDFTIKYLVLRKAYILALIKMNKEKWKDCCSEAISVFREAGIATVTTAGTVMKWHRFFRVHLSLKEDARKNTKEYVPKLFVVYPEARALINKYFIHNLESVNVDEFRNHVLDKVFPQLLSEMPVVVDGVEPLS